MKYVYNAAKYTEKISTRRAAIFPNAGKEGTIHSMQDWHAIVLTCPATVRFYKGKSQIFSTHLDFDTRKCPMHFLLAFRKPRCGWPVPILLHYELGGSVQK